MTMVRVDTDVKGYLVCPCGRKTLRYWTTEHEGGIKKFFLESHLPPGEKDPQKFCANSHLEIDNGDETPLLVYEGSMGRSRALVMKYGLGRPDEELVPLGEYKNNRLPMGILGRSLGRGDVGKVGIPAWQMAVRASHAQDI